MIKGLLKTVPPSWEEEHQDVLTNDAKEGLKLFWFGIGRQDFLLKTSDTTVTTVNMLQDYGFDIVYNKTPGGHSWHNWRNYLHTFSQKLFK